ADAMATSATTTSSSMSVKPDRLLAFTCNEPVQSSLPGADVGVFAVAADLAVGAQAVDVDLAVHARAAVLVRMAPRIVGQLVEVGLPVRRDLAGGGLGHERLQALLG